MKRNKSLGDEQHKCGMIEMVCRALQDSQREKDQLAAENARLKRLKAENPELEKLRAKNHALKKQITKQTSNMINERKKMIEKLKSSNLRLSKSKHQLTSLIQLLKFEKAKKKELEKVLKHMNMSLKVKEGEVITLNADLMLQEDKLRHSILENERKEEVQKKIREIDERWSSDYEEFLENEIKLEEDIELPIQQNMLPQVRYTNSFWFE